MESLKNRLVKESSSIGSDILKVDHFINHQIDVGFMKEIGEAIAERFKGEKIDKLLTVESGGIAVAIAAAEALACTKALFAKKTVPNTMTGECYTAEAKSFTKGTVSMLRVEKCFLNKGERILIVDDFLARGQAAMALVDIAQEAECEIVGVGAVIEKRFQGGSALLEERGIRVESLCVIDEIKDGVITFGQ